jgi:hypothetical protein
MPEVLELATRTYELESVGPCVYLLALVQEEGFYRVAVWNETLGRAVDLGRPLSTAFRAEGLEWFKQIAKVRS